MSAFTITVDGKQLDKLDDKAAFVLVGSYKDNGLRQQVEAVFGADVPSATLYGSSPRARIEVFENCTLAVLRMPLPDQGEECVTGVVRLLGNDEHVVLLLEDIDAQMISSLWQNQNQNQSQSQSQSQNQIKLNFRGMLTGLLKLISQAYLHESSEIDERMDGLEGTLFDGPTIAMQETLVALRRNIIEVKRLSFSHREVFLEAAEYESSDRKLMRIFENASHDFMRISERVDSMRDRAIIIQETLLTLSQAQLNNKLYWLSIVTVLFLPLAFLTGLLGINVNGIPWAQMPYGFEAVCGVLAGILVVEIILFRIFKWF